jgi:hypothetical protein
MWRRSALENSAEGIQSISPTTYKEPTAVAVPVSAKWEALMFFSMRSISVAVFGTLIMVAASRPTSADPIPISAVAFSGTEQVIQFTVATTQPLPYSEGGATFSPYPGPLSSVISSNNFLALAGPGTLTVTFASPVTLAGFDFFAGSQFAAPAPISAEVFTDPLGLQSLGAVNLGAFGPARQFVGFASELPFTRADITFGVATRTSSFVIDDFRFENTAPVPEPGTITLTVLGLGWMGSRIRRRLQASASQP